jgi:hypothetical protein
MKTEIKTEHPILFSTEMVKAVLDGSKTVTRRVIKLTPSLIYGLSGDSIQVFHSSGLNYENKRWDPVKAYTDFSKCRLHGGGRWEHLFSHQIQRLWAEGLRGLVCFSGMPWEQGLRPGKSVPQQQKDNKNNPQANLHVISWNARKKLYASSAPGRRQAEQHAEQSMLGFSAGELAGSTYPWDGECWRKTLELKANQRGTTALAMGVKKRFMFSIPSGRGFRHEPSGHFFNSPFKIGTRLWVRETFGISGNGPYFKTDVRQPETVKYAWTPAIHMPRRTSRINLEVTGVKVERLQDITEDQAQAEGVVFDGHYWSGVGHYIKGFPTCHPTAKSAFQGLWNSINAKRGYGWGSNPWVWAISFKRI